MSGATSVSINFTFAPAHTWYGDIRCIITSPSGASVLALAASCDGSLDDSSDLGGPYTISDGAPSLDAAANAAGARGHPGGHLRWRQRRERSPRLRRQPERELDRDVPGRDQRRHRDARGLLADVRRRCCGRLVLICQAGPFQPINLTHVGTPGTIYINPALANTPAAVPNGWAFGLDIPYPTFIDEVTMAPPLGDIFHGTIGASGTSVVVVPGVPPGWTIQIAGVHFDGVTGLPVYGSGGINYLVQ